MTTILALVAAGLAAAGPDAAPATGRLTGVVTTTAGAIHEGTIRWDANENFLEDRLDAAVALRFTDEDEERRNFGFNVFGFKLGGGRARPPSRGISVPFGAIRRLDFDDGIARAEMVDGSELVLLPLGSDLGPGCRGVVVGTADGDVELDCDDVASLVLRPIDLAPGPRVRAWGTVHAVDGEQRAGWIVWDRDESLAADVLDGDAPDGVTHAVPLGSIRVVERLPAASRLTLVDGTELELSGTNDVASGHRGVAVTIPGRGIAEIEWDDVKRVEFGEPPADAAAPSFAGARPVLARILTGDGGASATGRLLWGPEPRYAFETVSGRHGAFERAIPFERLSAIEHETHLPGRAVRLTFVDGATETLTRLDDRAATVGVEPGPSGGAPAILPWPAVRRIELVNSAPEGPAPEGPARVDGDAGRN